MSTLSVTTVINFSVQHCCQCGASYGVQKEWIQKAIDLGNFQMMHYCPHCGTKQGWGKSEHAQEVARLKNDLASKDRSIEYLRTDAQSARNEADHFRKSRDGMKGQLVKVKKRISCGVCPCCDRTFQNLQRHMATQHPDFNQPTP